MFAACHLAECMLMFVLILFMREHLVTLQFCAAGPHHNMATVIIYISL